MKSKTLLRTLLIMAVLCFAASFVVNQVQSVVIQKQRATIEEMTENPACTKPAPIQVSDN